MKKRSIRWAIFLVVGIIAAIISKHCKAEDAWDPLSGDPWQPPEWIVSEAPMPTATPEPTPEPTEDLPAALPTQGNLRGASTAVPTEVAMTPYPSYVPVYAIDNSLYNFKLLINYGRYSWTPSDSRRIYVVSNFSSINSYYLSLDNLYVYGSMVGTVSSNQSLKSTYFYNNTQTTVNDLSTRYHGVFLGLVLESNNKVIGNTYNGNLSFNWRSTLDLVIPSNSDDLSIFQAVGANASNLENTNVYVQVRVRTTKSQYLMYDYNINLAQLFTDFSIPIDTDSFADDEYLHTVYVTMLVNWIPESNPVYKSYLDYYTVNNITPSYYPTMNFTPLSNLSVRLVITEDQQVKKSWLKSALDWLFIPDPTMLSNLFSSSLGDPNTGGSYLALGMRQTLYNHVLSTDTPHAILNLPTIDIPLNNHSYRIFDGYTFDLTQFYNGTGDSRPPLATLIEAVRFIMTALMFSAFFQSLWSITCAVFGLHWWSGTSSEDISEADV